MEVSELINSYHAGRRNFAGVNLSKTDMNGIDLSHADLSGANLRKADPPKCANRPGAEKEAGCANRL